MQIVDPHHHLWDLETNFYPWLREPYRDRGWGDWSSLRQNYLVEDFLLDAWGHELLASVHVQANFDPSRPLGETEWLERVAEDPASRGFPQGIVAFVDLSAADAAVALSRQASHPRVRGVRQVLNRHREPSLNRAPRDYLADPAWRSNFALLAGHGFSFDAQVYQHQMPELCALADAHPETTIILDHCGMPAERDPESLRGWREGMRELARRPNMRVKLCGFGMVDLDWTAETIRPFVLHAIEQFGPERSMFASNFPVDKLMATYDRLWGAYDRLTEDFSMAERENLFVTTAACTYRLDLP
jgi:predicted TIM-barrel fold metal-dependent hydrolase